MSRSNSLLICGILNENTKPSKCRGLVAPLCCRLSTNCTTERASCSFTESRGSSRSHSCASKAPNRWLGTVLNPWESASRLVGFMGERPLRCGQRYFA